MIEAIIVGILAALVSGMGLAVWTDNPAWLIMSVAAFCVLYAG